MKKIIIEKLRRIIRLEFEIPSLRGRVYLLTGANGTGKSTLMTCLARIGYPRVFDRFFRLDVSFGNSDNNFFSETSISYTYDRETASVHCIDGVWQADDQAKLDDVFQKFDFPEVAYAGVRHRNETIGEQKFSQENIQPVPERLRNIVREVFDDDKFLALLSIPMPSAPNENVFLMKEKIQDKEYYFSENNFSAGERSVIRLFDLLLKLSANSLVLVDEAEMALHPKAERRLVDQLVKICREKNLTLILSTHSASLIKLTDPKYLLFLETEPNGNILCHQNVYPAAILGEMAIAEEILPETILLVEDAEAAMLLEAIINKLKTAVDVDFPYCKILPVGGYMQVVILLDNLSKVFPPFVKRRAVLDRDAEHAISRTANNPASSHFDVVQRNLDRIYYLPCAPEQGVIRLLESNPKYHSKHLAEALESPPFHLLDIMHGNEWYRELRGTSRADCKEKLTIIVDHIKMITGDSRQTIRKKIYRYYVDNNYRNIKDLKEDYCALIFKR